MQAAGFRLELRRQGDVALGLWRKELRTLAGGQEPRRLVVVPGFGDSPLSWLPVWTALLPLASSYFDEIVYLDFPGFGGWLSEMQAFDSMDRLIEAVSDALDDLRPHTLFGHSLGGWLSGHYLADTGRQARPKHPVRMGITYSGPERTILACPAGIFESKHARDIWENKFRRASEEGFASFRSELFSKEPIWFGLMTQEFTEFFARPDIRAFMASIQEGHLLTDKLVHAHGEIWLLFADLDQIAPVTALPMWERLLAGQRLGSVVIRDCGHGPHLEKLTVMIAVLGQILAGKSPSAQGGAWYRVTPPSAERGTSASPSEAG